MDIIIDIEPTEYVSLVLSSFLSLIHPFSHSSILSFRGVYPPLSGGNQPTPSDGPMVHVMDHGKIHALYG